MGIDFEWVTFLDAIALVFIIEGIMPFIRPESFRKYLETMQKQSDSFIRIMGFVSMLFGLLVLYLVRLIFDI